MSKQKHKRKSVRNGVKRDFIRRQILANSKVTDDDIIECWKANYPKVDLKKKAVRRERTLFENVTSYDTKQGLQNFFSSQTALLLEQYQHIEQLLGPPDSDWLWIGEHCEVLLRDAIKQFLPPSLAIAKGYIHGVHKDTDAVHRCPELDILIYDQEKFAPLFSMGEFVIVYPESVVAAIQVKRSLSADSLKAAVENVVAAKRHVRDTCRLNSATNTQKMFTAVVAYEEGIKETSDNKLSASYKSAIAPHITEFHHSYILPDFIGSLSKLFLLLTGVNVNAISYQAFSSREDGNEKGRNISLAVLLFRMMQKIRPYGLHLPAAFPEKMKVIDCIEVWKKPDD